jgi:hypothetical protein
MQKQSLQLASGHVVVNAIQVSLNNLDIQLPKVSHSRNFANPEHALVTLVAAERISPCT